MSKVEFKKGDRVRYIPYHVMGDAEDSDCEDGVVSSVKDENLIFVKYDNEAYKMITGDEDYTAQLTNIKDLILLDSQEEVV